MRLPEEAAGTLRRLAEVLGRRGIPPELAVLVPLGAVLRIYDLGTESLWIDEVFTTTMATERTLRELLFVVPTFEPHPPLYNVFVWAWVRLAGESAVAVRAPSVVFGVAAIPLVYVLGRDLFDRWTATAATLLFTVSPLQIWYAQEARMYALLVAATLVSFLAYRRLPDATDRRSTAVYVVAALVLGYTHVYGLFVLLAQGTDAVRRRYRGDGGLSWRRITTLYGGLLLGLSPWTGLLVARTLVPEWFPPDAAAWLRAPTGLELADALRLLSVGATRDTRPYDALAAPSDVFVFVVGLCLFLVVAFYTLGAFDSQGRSVRLLTVWLLATVGVPLVISATVRPIFQLRYLTVASPAVLLLAARGSRAVSVVPVRYVLVGLLLFGTLAPLPGYYAEPTRDQWDVAAADVSDRVDADDVVLVVPGWTWDGPSDAFAYYFDRPDVAVEPLYSFSPPGSFADAVAGHDDVVLVVSYTNERAAVVDRVANATGTAPTDRREYVSVVVVAFERGDATQGSDGRVTPSELGGRPTLTELGGRQTPARRSTPVVPASVSA